MARSRASRATTSRTGETIDAATAFVAAAVAGITLFLPVAVRARPAESSYQLTDSLNNVPRSAAQAVIVAVLVAVAITTISRPVLGWATAATGSVAQLINHLTAPRVPSADLLTTQNYLDAVCGAVVLGALGAVVLHRALPAAGFALGGISFFAFGGLAQMLGINPNLSAVSETPPRWTILAAAALLLTSTVRNRAPVGRPEPLRLNGDLPLAPIFAAIVLAVVVLATTEWLGRLFSKAPDDSHVVAIGIVVAATILSTTAAAMLLPGRDGVGVYLAVCLTAAADAVGYAPRPAWAVAILVALAAIGIAAGNRTPSISIAIMLIAGIAIFGITGSASGGRAGFVVISVVIALTAGYCCGVARPNEASSGVLAIAALYLPTVVSVSPTAARSWHGEDPAHNATPAIAALALAVGCAFGIMALCRFRARGS
ncbi:hypothetical protein [Nocardia sp. NPDC050710]|uniref:hypothetical protein n=1 Tax=Nocardia sp. NPDC050710 TaxID=3157220 RepID=UPI0033D73D69